MAKRREVFTEHNLASLMGFHPYLFIFQKEDWRDYLYLIAQIYDYLEDQKDRVPFESLRFFVQRLMQEKLPSSQENMDDKVFRVLRLYIEELGLLKDSHDQYGQRYVDSTRSGKDFLAMMEGFLVPQTKFSGTGAETLLGALNSLLVARSQMSLDEAVGHHKQWIRKYQDDLTRIQKMGVEAGELLPLPHSNEALFSQAEMSAKHILSSIEDVKEAIEKQRKQLAEIYLGATQSPGKSVNMVADFYQRLYMTQEYRSYEQAKLLFSFLETYSQRYKERNIDLLLHEIADKQLIDPDEIRRSYLSGFARQFADADRAILEKTSEQVRILKLQVNYALNNDMHGGESVIRQLYSKMMSHRQEFSEFFKIHPLQIEIPQDYNLGDIELASFRKIVDVESAPVELVQLDSKEYQLMIEELKKSEEATVEVVIEKFKTWLREHPGGTTLEYPFSYGLAEYYILNEIELFIQGCQQEKLFNRSLFVPTKYGDFVLKDAPIYRYYWNLADKILNNNENRGEIWS